MNSEFLVKSKCFPFNENIKVEAIDKVFSKKRTRENYTKLNDKKNEILEKWFSKNKYPKKRRV